jgi:hypothetical protein
MLSVPSPSTPIADGLRSFEVERRMVAANRLLAPRHLAALELDAIEAKTVSISAAGIPGPRR